MRPGDSLAGIAAAMYGSAAAWTVIYYANRRAITSGVTIYPGVVLTVAPLPARIPAPPAIVVPAPAAQPSSGAGTPPPPPSGGAISFAGLENLWTAAGGPGGTIAWDAAMIAECESGGNPNAYNPSGASGLWQILGQVVPGDIFSPVVNAENAVAKYRDSGDTFAAWVCQP